MITIQAVVSGKVQGVWFRASAAKKAVKLSIVGWVRNCSDGAVELQATGEAANIDQFVQWLHKGPVLARVDQVKVTPCELQLFDEFSIK